MLFSAKNLTAPIRIALSASQNLWMSAAAWLWTSNRFGVITSCGYVAWNEPPPPFVGGGAVIIATGRFALVRYELQQKFCTSRKAFPISKENSNLLITGWDGGELLFFVTKYFYNDPPPPESF